MLEGVGGSVAGSPVGPEGPALGAGGTKDIKEGQV